MEKRINLIMNGKRDLSLVLRNLHKLFESQDKILIYTKSEKDEFINCLKDSLHLDDSGINAEVYYEKFNEIDYEYLKNNGTKKIIGVKMPNSLFHTISTAYNDAFKFVDNTEVAEYVHCFADDCAIANSERYDPTVFEWFMDTFDEPFVMDSKTNPGNYAFKKYSPRFVFISSKYLKSPISFVQFESKEHFIINRSKLKENFDNKLNRLYITEYIMRLHENGIIKHPSFYPDPVIETWVKRAENLHDVQNIEDIAKDYADDEKYLKETVKKTLQIENSVDPIVNELGKIIEKKLKNSEVKESHDNA